MPLALCYFIGIAVALWVTLMIAFPEHLAPEFGGRKKKFTGRHWGTYNGVHQNPEEEDGIEVGIPAKKIRHVVGSSTYAGGRGVSMRG